MRSTAYTQPIYPEMNPEEGDDPALADAGARRQALQLEPAEALTDDHRPAIQGGLPGRGY